jgi:DNA-binding CsgD family transcriptional regulator
MALDCLRAGVRLGRVIRPPDSPLDDRRRAAGEAAARLSPRLREVLDGLLAGEGEKELAGRLLLSKHTVHQYAKLIYRHFDVRSRAELSALLMMPVADARDPEPPAPGLINRLIEPQRLPAPPAEAPEEEHIYYCVNLLERRGYLVRCLQATRRFGRRRRGLVAVMTLTLLAGVSGLVMLGDVPRETGGPRSLAEDAVLPRLINVSLGPAQQAAALGPMALGQRLSWRTTPEGAAVEVTVGSRLLLEPDHVVQIPGPLQVRAVGNDQPVVVHLMIDPVMIDPLR